jgi:beta-glucosidase
VKRFHTLTLSAVACAALLGASFPSAAVATGARTSKGAERPAELPAGQKRLMAFDARAKEIVAKMTLEEKVGQMTQAEQDALKDINDIEKYYLGSLLSGGSSDPKAGNSLQAWTELYERLQAHTQNTRLKIPLLYGIDAVHGHSNVLGAVIFPHNIGLGATRNPKLVEEIGRITALEMKATGIHWTFAPCVAVPQDERWGRTYEGFGETTELATMFGGPAVRGLQGNSLADPHSVLACAKHFAGDGGTTWGTGLPRQANPNERWALDQGDVRLSEEALRALHIKGYETAIAAGVGTIMPSYNSWNGEKASGSKRLLTDILKDEMGFEGFLISDYNALDQLPGNFKENIAQSINAGMDMVMVPTKYQEFWTLLKQNAEEGKIPMARIDDAVTRILRVKLAMGMMEKGWSYKADPKLQKAFGSAAHRKVARDAVRQSLVLLKNENNALPLSKSLARIHVGGKNADDIGNQCGGWTIDWQGKSGNVTTGGTTILKAIRDTVSRKTKVTFSKDGSGAEGADVGVVVVGETPYAEMQGDREDLSLAPEDVAAIETMKKAGIPVVVILVSGRPMIVENVLGSADAFIAAWLPGTEGQGVADVLFGDYKPTGKLPMTWPRSMAQIPINKGDASYDPLFAYGYGLSY